MFQKNPLGRAKGPVTFMVPPQALQEVSLILPRAKHGSLLIVLFPIRKKGQNKPNLICRTALSLHSGGVTVQV